jgi:hypothetical protein
MVSVRFFYFWCISHCRFYRENTVCIFHLVSQTKKICNCCNIYPLVTCKNEYIQIPFWNIKTLCFANILLLVVTVNSMKQVLRFLSQLRLRIAPLFSCLQKGNSVWITLFLSSLIPLTNGKPIILSALCTFYILQGLNSSMSISFPTYLLHTVVWSLIPNLTVQGGSDKSGILKIFLENHTAQLKIIQFY